MASKFNLCFALKGSGTFRLKMIGEILRDFISPNYISLYFDEKYSDLKGPNSKPDERKDNSVEFLSIGTKLSFKKCFRERLSHMQ